MILFVKMYLTLNITGTRYPLDFRVLLSLCGLHAIEDQNRVKPLYLRTASFEVTAWVPPFLGVGVMFSLATFEGR